MGTIYCTDNISYHKNPIYQHIDIPESTTFVCK